jgi:hypothetical protein
MRFSRPILILVLVLTISVGCSPKRDQFSIIQAPSPPGATNALMIHLQEGFDGGREIIIAVDGRQVYKGTPKTDPRLGLAGRVSAAAISDHPIVTLEIPTGGVGWSQKIDLKAGAALGVSVSTNGHVQYWQRDGFGYD